MLKRTREYLDNYRQEFMALERQCRNQCEAWEDILHELHIDRGTLLGSEHYQDLSGVERANVLRQIDEAIGLSYSAIKELKARRDELLQPQRGYQHRCARIRRQVCALSDSALGVSE